MQLRIVPLCAALFAVCLPQTALGFGSAEHEKIGNLGFRVALHFMQANFRFNKTELAAMQALDGAPGKYMTDSTEDRKLVSYGDITTCVDFFLYPAMLLAQVNEKLEQPLFKLSQCRGLFGPTFAQATHNNQAHFQHDALLSYQLMHQAAASIVDNSRVLDDDERRGEIIRGLVLNAMADHFLQDFLAPGHVVTKRQALSDVVATAVHDRANENNFEKKLTFQPSHEWLTSLNVTYLLRSLCEAGTNPCQLRKGLDALAATKENGERETAQDLGEALQALLEKRESIVMRGDDLLWQGNAEQRKQRLFMVLVTAQSVVDTIFGESSFTRPQWEEKDAVPTVAKMLYGEYLLKEADAPVQGPVLGIADMRRIVGISGGRENMIAHGRAARWTISAETIGGAAADNTSRLNLIWTAGLTYYGDSGVHGWGPVVRAAYIFPQTEYWLGGYIRELSYPYPEYGRDTRRFAWGVRFDTGFSSFFTVFLSLGRDFGTTPEGRFDKGLVGGVGLEVLLPTSQIGRRR